MLCFRYKKLLVPYAEGALGDDARRGVERHIARCKRCTSDLNAINLVSGALKRVDDRVMEPSPDLWARVSAQIADETSVRRPLTRIRLVGSAAAYVVLAGLVIVGGFQAMRISTTPQRKPAVVASNAPEPKNLPPAREEHNPGWAGASATPSLKAYHMPKPGHKAPRKRELPVEPDLTASKPALPVPAAPVTVAAAPAGEDYAYRADYADAPAVTAELKSAPTSASPNLSYTASARMYDDKSTNAYGVTAYSSARRDERSSGELVDSIKKAPASAGNSVINAADVDLALKSAANVNSAKKKDNESVVDALNETEGVRTAALFTYP